MNKRKRQVLLTAQRIFIDKGFSTSSVQDILDEAGISKGTFYNYFSSKNECLMAILENARDEASVRRRELLIDQDLSNKNILVEQIIIRMHVNREKNVLPIFEAIFHSGDQELKKFLKDMFLDELSWLKKRLVDVYGKESAPYATDFAVMLFGMMHLMTNAWSIVSTEEIDATKLINYLLRRTDSMFPAIISTEDIFFEEDIFSIMRSDEISPIEDKQQLLERLRGFLDLLAGDDTCPAGKQYVQFLVDELSAESPRLFVLESIIHSFREAYSGTDHESEARELAHRVWKFTDTIR